MLNTEKNFNSVRALIQSVLRCRATFHHWPTSMSPKKKGAVSPLTVNKWTLRPLCASAEQTVHRQRHCAIQGGGTEPSKVDSLPQTHTSLAQAQSSLPQAQGNLAQAEKTNWYTRIWA